MLAGDWRVWQQDRQQVEQEIVEGRPFQVWDTERGRYDSMLAHGAVGGGYRDAPSAFEKG